MESIKSEDQDTPITAFVPFIPPTDPAGDLTDIYRWLSGEVNEFHGVQFEPLMESPGSDDDDLSQFGFQINTEMVSAEQQPHVRRSIKVNRGLFKLGQQAHKTNDHFVAQLLVKSAIYACELVQRLQKTNPDLIDQAASKSYQWPQLVTLGRVPQDTPQNLGTDHLGTLGIKSASFKGIGDIICRQYALNIMYALSMNRSFLHTLGDQYGEFTAFLHNKYDREVVTAKWLPECATLPELNKDTVAVWMKLGRKIVRACDPDFHERYEWRDYTLRAQNEAGGVAKKIDGYKRRAIFSDIASALKIIAIDKTGDERGLQNTS